MQRSKMLKMSMAIYGIRIIIVLFVVILPASEHIFVQKQLQIQTKADAKQIAVTTVPTPPAATPILTVQGPLPTISARVGYLVDEKTGNVLFDQKGEETVPMASTTKIMTALVAIQTADLKQEIPVTQMDADHIYKDDGSSAGLVVGDELSLKDMLYALLLPSGDDAAYAIAQALGGGSINNYVQRMNLFAEHHDLFQTHYDNPDGLNEAGDMEQYASAQNLVQLASYAMTIPTFAQIVHTPKYTVTTSITTYNWVTTNTLLGAYNGMIGIKTGHTDAAGYCLVFEAVRGDDTLIGAVLGNTTQDQRDQDVQKLLNWGFALPMRVPVYH